MQCNRKFYKCSVCGNIVALIEDGGGPLSCCGKPMDLLEPNTADAAGEKHVPVLECQDGKAVVKVGSVPHPMTEAHWIQWVYVCTGAGEHRYPLNPGDEPVVPLPHAREDIAAVFAYCNLHGLWQAEIADDEEIEVVCHADFSQGCI